MASNTNKAVQDRTSRSHIFAAVHNASTILPIVPTNLPNLCPCTKQWFFTLSDAASVLLGAQISQGVAKGDGKACIH